jgi:hypothetical protein
VNRAQVRVVARGRGGVQGRRYDRGRDGEERVRMVRGACEEGCVLAYNARRRPSHYPPCATPSPNSSRTRIPTSSPFRVPPPPPQA